MELDTAVKLKIYETAAGLARLPTAPEIAEALGVPLAEVEASFSRLYAKRLLVPEPGDDSRIRMAPPFSGVPTPFLVIINEKQYYANCVWDAFGIPAALRKDAEIQARDGFTGESLTLHVRQGKPLAEPCVIHFAVPAALWWKDIIYT